ncbi:hypothetical protein ACH492_28015 [Streptomyces sp. NPDC019443]
MEVICRDLSRPYAEGARAGAPQAVPREDGWDADDDGYERVR